MDSKVSGQEQRSQPRKGLGHSLGGHGLLLEGDEGHPQRLVLDPALLLCDSLCQLVLHARVISNGILLPEDRSPCDAVALCRWQGDPRACSPGQGVGPHPLAALYFAAAELAAGLGIDEGPLAGLRLQVCVIGQALLSLFPAVGCRGGDKLQTHSPVARWTPHLPFNHESPPELGVQLSEQVKGRASLLPSQGGI